jgi:hypothetical protein
VTAKISELLAVFSAEVLIQVGNTSIKLFCVLYHCIILSLDSYLMKKKKMFSLELWKHIWLSLIMVSCRMLVSNITAFIDVG